MADYSIIIAAPDFDSQLPVLSSLRECHLDPDRYEIVLALGNAPSRQRNAALARSTAPVCLFLDSDCRVTPDYFQRLESIFRDHSVDVAGGPVLLENGDSAPAPQRLFQAALSHPLVVGKTAARYHSHGTVRDCTDAELILCNLAVRRKLFSEFGTFNESLYPNEENEWLDRVASHACIRHDPLWVVHRPQRANWNDLAKTLLRYGAGRTRQTQVSRRWNFKLLPLAALLLWLIASFVARLETGSFSFLFGVLYVTVIAATCPPTPRLSWFERLQVGVTGLGIVFFYALGQLLGLTGWPPSPPSQPIRLVTPSGQPWI